MKTNIYQKRILSLFQKKHMLTISQVHEAIPEADYSTIFRNIDHLFKNNQLKAVTTGKKSVMYELAENDHAHFVCDDCGRIESIYLAVGKTVEGRLIKDVLLKGICTDCAK